MNQILLGLVVVVMLILAIMIARQITINSDPVLRSIERTRATGAMKTVFLFTDMRSPFPFDISMLGMAVNGMMIFFSILASSLYKKGERLQIKPNQLVPTVLFFLVWTFILLSFSSFLQISTNNEYQQLTDIYIHRKYQVVEGTVKVLFEEPAGGHAKGDTIQIGKTTLSFSHFIATLAYTDTLAHGGVLKDGVYARIYYVRQEDPGKNDLYPIPNYDCMILRIDLKQNP